VGTNGGPSFYGTFDMNGNVSEWNDLIGVLSYRGVRGGGLNGYANSLSSGDLNIYPPSTEASSLGFRLAGTVPSGVPEIDPAAGGSAFSLVAGVLAMVEQRRRRAALEA
jgi:hypothetical protein